MLVSLSCLFYAFLYLGNGGLAGIGSQELRKSPVYTTVKAKLSCLYSPKSSLMYSNGKERAAGELNPSKISSIP